MEAREVMLGSRFFTSTLLILVAMAVASCTKPHETNVVAPQPSKPWTGLTQDVRAVWSAEPGIDLVRGPAVVVRAYIESYFLAREMGTIDATYPGFTRAVPPTTSDSDPLADPWPQTSHPAPHPIVGTDKRHILRIDKSGSSTVAIVCDYSTYTSAFDQGNGTFGYPTGVMDDGVGTWRMAMSAASNATGSLPPQRGPAAAPVTDVFGDWRIESWESSLATYPNWPTSTADSQACRALAPDPIERRKALRNGTHPRSDYPTLPPYPGWPEAGPA